MSNSDVKKGSVQDDAIVHAKRHEISVIAGSPGTGKTYVQAEIANAMLKDMNVVICTAPTGTASKKLYMSCIAKNGRHDHLS